jgi:hypothetical protein
MKKSVRVGKVIQLVMFTKQCGMSMSVQKDSCNAIRLCNKEFKALVTQDTSTSNSESSGFM